MYQKQQTTQLFRGRPLMTSRTGGEAQSFVTSYVEGGGSDFLGRFVTRGGGVKNRPKSR